MKITMAIGLSGVLMAGMVVAGDSRLAAQDNSMRAAHHESAGLILGHPFSAIKYARSVKALPDGKKQFVRNERYPTRIARDADGRLMMQVLKTNDLQPECDRLDLLVPPVCPAWTVFVINPVAHTVMHWADGEIARHAAVEFPLTPERLKDTADATSALPPLEPDFSDQDGKVTIVDLGDKTIDGIAVHGVRWMLRQDVNPDGHAVQRMRIHEVWTSPEMQLIVRVIDGDPNGDETIWGLEITSLAPNAALFQPPDGYEIEQRGSDRFAAADFENLKTWFEK